LVSVQKPEIVDGGEGRRVVRVQGLLLHQLRLAQLALVSIQKPKIVDGFEGGDGV